MNRKNGLKLKYLAEKYNVSIGTIKGIIANKTWKK